MKAIDLSERNCALCANSTEALKQIWNQTIVIYICIYI